MNSKKCVEFQTILPVIYYKHVKNEVVIVVSSSNVLFSLNVLKKTYKLSYKLLSCISGVDLLNKNYRFCVAYDLLSLTYNSRLRIKAFVNEITSLVSSISVFVNANWWEREIWDLYGIYFDKHSDLRRILTDYGFEGHPMRKDFPLFGYVELRYNQNKKRVISEKVQLTQEFRSFSF